MDIKSLNSKMKSDFHKAGYTGKNINLVSIDTGVRTTVPYGHQLVSGHFNAFLPTEDHGSKTASVLASWCPDAKIIVYNAQSPELGIEGPMINWIFRDVIERAKSDKSGRRYIVTMSYLFAGLPDTHNLVKELVSMNVPVIVAAGNDGQERPDRYPGCWPEPICIAALNRDGTPATFSTWHNEMDFADLGVGVDAVDWNGKWVSYDGTSAAQPEAAGKIALLLDQNPTLTEPELFHALQLLARDLQTEGYDPHTGYGLIDITQPVVKEDTMLSAQALINYFQKAVDEKWGYVWSLNGELYTRAMAEEYHRIKRSTSEWRDPATYWLQDCARWIGKMAADCSGGIVGAMRTIGSYKDRTANTFFNECTESGKISTIPEIPGLCVHRSGHIGIYKGNDRVLEFRGTEYGAVETRLSQRNFTHWGKLRDIDYGEEVPIMGLIVVKDLIYNPTIKLYQEFLNVAGYPCGDADGKAGDKTIAAHGAFVAANGGSANIALPDTITLAFEVADRRYTVEAKRD